MTQIDETTTLRAIVDRAEGVLAEWLDAFGGDLEEVEEQAGRTVAEILGDLRKALDTTTVQAWLDEPEKALPLIVQIMQAQYLSMTSAMNRQVALANDQRDRTARTLVKLYDAMNDHQHRLQGVGIQIAAPEIERALVESLHDVTRVRKEMDL